MNWDVDGRHKTMVHVCPVCSLFYILCDVVDVILVFLMICVTADVRACVCVGVCSIHSVVECALYVAVHGSMFLKNPMCQVNSSHKYIIHHNNNIFAILTSSSHVMDCYFVFVVFFMGYGWYLVATIVVASV